MEAQDSHLLVVDDNERNRDILSRQLRRHGYDVVLAEDGARALEIVDERPVDLVILDIMMPGIDGIQVLERLRKTHSPAELPIIMATARSDTQDIVLTAQLGANDHVAKPVDFDVLVAKIQALLLLKEAATPAAAADGEPTLGELRAGSVLAGKYRLEERIGSGNYGAVYKARHRELDLEVAVKVLQPSLTANDDSLKRFRQEGVAACRVNHPNAVYVSDYGVTETGVAFLVMELLEGRPLTAELRARGKLSPRRANEILQPLCDVLAEAHAKDLVHRDIKPGNVFLHRTSRGEVVKVLDFGIAKLVGEAAVQDSLTAEGWVLGTPAYMAPERLFDRAYDGRADVYSVGVMLFEMLTGRKPFRSRTNDPMSMIHQHAKKKPPKLRSIDPELPAALEELIASALSKDPRKRPDATTLAREFARRVRESEPCPASGAPNEVPGSGRTSRTMPTLSAEALAGESASPRLLGRWLNKIRKP